MRHLPCGWELIRRLNSYPAPPPQIRCFTARWILRVPVTRPGVGQWKPDHGAPKHRAFPERASCSWLDLVSSTGAGWQSRQQPELSAIQAASRSMQIFTTGRGDIGFSQPQKRDNKVGRAKRRRVRRRSVSCSLLAGSLAGFRPGTRCSISTPTCLVDLLLRGKTDERPITRVRLVPRTVRSGLDGDCGGGDIGPHPHAGAEIDKAGGRQGPGQIPQEKEETHARPKHHHTTPYHACFLACLGSPA